MIVAQECPIFIDVLTRAQNNRPQLAMPDASYVTVHEVGNTADGADELMHRNFVWNGGGEFGVSFHFVVGPTCIYQLLYLNENAWHASDYYAGRGNRDSIAIETVQIGDFEGKTLPHLAFLIAELYAHPERFAWRPDVSRTDDLPAELLMERTKQHNFWAPDHKNCPQFIRERGLWVPLLTAAAKHAQAPVTSYLPPILPAWWSEAAVLALRVQHEDGVRYQPLGTRLTALENTQAYVHPWQPEAKGKRTRAVITAGEAVDLRYTARHPETGKEFGITKHGTWVALSRFTPRIIVRARDV